MLFDLIDNCECIIIVNILFFTPAVLFQEKFISADNLMHL
jgi:hypothetical protein